MRNLRNKTFLTRRCHWCDTVDNFLCQNIPGNYRRAPKDGTGYKVDPFGKQEKLVLCHKCYDVYQSTMDEFLVKDLEKEFKDENLQAKQP